MREDLNKQICERERVGHSRKFRDVRRKKLFSFDEESGPQREGITKRYSNKKDFNENLNPLYGAVRKAIGRPWNKFYSELCKTFDKRSVINQHILQHLKDFIAYDTFLKDDAIWVQSYCGPIPLKGDRYFEFYVDPKDGIIKKNKSQQTNRQHEREFRNREAIKRAKEFHEIDSKNVLRLIDGVWYHFTLEKIPRCDVIYRKPMGADKFFPYGPSKPVNWEQLSDWDKSRFGTASLSGKPAHDLFSGQRLYHDGARAQVWNGGGPTGRAMRHYPPRGYGAVTTLSGISGKNQDMYHATKKTASHKILKKAGLAS